MTTASAPSAPAGANPAGLPTVRILEAEIHNVSRAELFPAFTRGALFTPNVDFVMLMHRDPEFRALFHQAEFRICDSQILKYAANFLGTPLKEKISGSDFLREFCAYHRDHPEYRIFFLGGPPGVAELARRKVNERLGTEFVVGAYCPPFGFESDPVENAKALAAIEASGAGAVAVGLGAPKQERWIVDNRDRLPGVRCYMGIGGSFAFEAGTIRRAPRSWSNLGLEWAWRLSREPRRLWRRYLIEDTPFFALLLRQKLARTAPAGPS